VTVDFRDIPIENALQVWYNGSMVGVQSCKLTYSEL
jgi:hypothetical protein